MRESNADNMVIGFDLDGVIFDHTQNKIRIASRYGYELTPEDTHAEVMGALFPPEIYREIKSQLYDEADGNLAAPLMSGAFAGLATLKEKGIPYFLVSLQKNPMHAMHLIELHGLWGEYFTPENTYFVKNAEEKHQAAKALNVSHFIDDEPNILEVMTTIDNRVLFDTRDLFSEKTEYQRVKDWGELGKVLGITHV